MKTISKVLISSIPLSLAGVVYLQMSRASPSPEALQVPVMERLSF